MASAPESLRPIDPFVGLLNCIGFGTLSRMDRISKSPFGIAAAAAFLCVSLAAQQASHKLSIFQRKSHSNTQTETGPATPFPLGREAPPETTDVVFRSPHRMSAADRQLKAESESAIAAHAAFENFHLDDGQWTYQQIACRALPNHLFLRFTRDSGPRDGSVFSVSIPRTGNGRLRLIPIQRRGFSLYSPAPSNRGTVAAFNQIRREDGPNPDAGWLETALCYAALAGANPSVGPLTGDAVLEDPAPPVAEMLVTLDGGAIVTFTDEAAHPHPILWNMTFNPKGALLKVNREPAVLNARKIMPAQSPPHHTTILPVTAVRPDAGTQSETSISAPPAQPASRQDR